MQIDLLFGGKEQAKTDLLAVSVFEGEHIESSEQIVNDFLKDNLDFGRLYESQLLYTPNLRILLVGAGKKEKFDYEKLQNWAGAATKMLLHKGEEAVIAAPDSEMIDPSRLVEAMVIGIGIASYDIYSMYKSEKKTPKLKRVKILLSEEKKEYVQGLEKGLKLLESINLARTLGDMPPNEMTPTYFLNVARDFAHQNNLKLIVIDEKEAEIKGMGAFVAVAKGSDEPSFMIAIEYQGDPKNQDKWALVGKGVTFDSGGISIKPSGGMHEMKYDMCGAATVLASLMALVALKAKVNVAAVMAVTENLPSGKSLKPGDIIKTYSGKTAEVLNTDAEGRLLLIDAVSFAQKDLHCNKVIDLATLTGAMIVALGDFYTGVFSNNDQFAKKLIEAGRKVGERFWQMPMDEIYNDMIKSEFADIANLGHGSMGERTAGAITGAKFIEAGIENNTLWIHLDIAGTAWDMKSREYRGVGATGVGVKTLVELILGGI